jgi:RNA polymerase sigma factor (sigma-70 family)
VTLLNDSDIAEALKTLAVSRRDEEAWETLYRHSWPFVRAIIYRRLGAVEGLVDDAAQEVFVRLLRSCPFSELRSPDAFRGYLWRVSDNVARRYRQQIVMSRTVALPDEGALPPNNTSVDLLDDVELGQLLQSVWRQSTEAERGLLRLLIEGYSIGEIAQKLRINYGTAAIRIMRLRRRLRKSFAFKGIRAAVRTED